MSIYRLLLLIAFWLSAPVWVNGQTDQESSEVVTDYSLYQPLTFTADTLSIPYNHAKKKFGVYMYQTVGDTLYFHEKNSNTILMFNWKTKKVLPAIKLTPIVEDEEKLYPGNVMDVLMISSDSILVVQTYRLTLINAKGKMVQHWDMGDPDAFDDWFADGVWYQSYNIIYKPEGKVYIHRMNAACGNDDFYKCPDHRIESLFDLKTGNFDTLAMKFSPLYKTRNYGGLKDVARIEVGNKHIYSFHSDPNLYVLDLLTDSITVVGAKSKHQTADTLYYTYERELEMQEVLDLYMQGAEYIGLWHDPHQQLIFRFFKAEQPLKNAQGKANGIMDKDLYLMVFDMDLNLLGEIHLGNTYGQLAFVTPSGLMVSKMSPNNPGDNDTHILFNAIKVIR